MQGPLGGLVSFSVPFELEKKKGNHLSSAKLALSVAVLLIELADPDPNLGMGASGAQTSGVAPKGTNKRRAV